jgi:allophanate hydrolase
MSASLKVIAPGILTSVQDLGRVGFQHLGVPVSGALDPVALRLANLLVGNADGEAGLEIMHMGPTLEVCADSVRVALAGGNSVIEVMGRPQPVPAFQSVRLERGEQFRMASTADSATAYLAVEGGFDIPEIMGSRSTYARGGFGGHCGRALAAGDELPLRAPQAAERREQMLTQAALPRPETVRIVLGPQEDHFTADAAALMSETAYQVSRASDRMGMRLEGEALTHRDSSNIVSDGIAPGAIQVPGDGLPIILLADRQTTGGYPKIATVISCDLPGLGRLRPGDRIGFQVITLEEAATARQEARLWVSRLARSIKPLEADAPPDERLLHSENIIGGVIHATEPE